MRTIFCVAGAYLAVMLAHVSAQAGFIGHTIEATAYFPTLPAPNEPDPIIAGPVSAVVGPGPEFLTVQLPFQTIDFADTSISIRTFRVLHLPATFNGYRFFDVLGTIDSIVGVSILADDTGFFSADPSRIFFDADNIFVNFESLDHRDLSNPSTVLGVTFATATIPEPASVALFAVSLAVLGLAWRRKNI